MSKKGQLLITAVFVLIIVAVLGIVAASTISTESFSVARNWNGMQALNVAEAGMRFTIATSLCADSDYSDNADFGPVSLNPGYFTVHYTFKSQRQCSVEVTGTVTGVSRTVRTKTKKTGGGLQAIANEYVLYWGGSGGGSSSLGNNTNINGDIFLNANLSIGNNSNMTGTIEATNNVNTGNNFNLTGSIETHVPTPEGQPTLETTYYDGQIYIANTNPTYTGNQTFSGLLAPGAYYVKGNVTLGSLTLTGVTTIVATGTIDVGNNKTIGDSLAVIAGGAITIGNSVTIGQNGLWYSSVGITSGNSAAFSIGVGLGTSFITPGDIIFNNTSSSKTIDYKGFMYAGGMIDIGNNFNFSGLMVCNYADIKNNAILTLNPSAVNYGSVPGIIATGPGGISGFFDVSDWGEVY